MQGPVQAQPWKRYVDRLQDTYFNNTLFKNLDMRTFTEFRKDLIQSFASVQDHMYGYPSDNYEWFQSHFTDDIIQIVLGVWSFQNLTDKALTDLKPLMHDAWALARLIKFDGNSVQPYSESGVDGDPNKQLVDIPFIFNGKQMTAKVQQRRVKQFVEYSELPSDEKNKDLVTANTFLAFWKINRDAMTGIYTTITTKLSQGGFTKTAERVQLGGRSAVVYKGQRGGKYVKQNNEFVSLKRAQSRIKST